MRAYERLLKYVRVGTPSDHNSTTVPTSHCQFELANILAAELKELGIADAYADDKCYVYGILPATAGCESATKIGFVAEIGKLYCI